LTTASRGDDSHVLGAGTQLICGPKPTVQSLGLGSNEREVLKKSVTNRKRTRSEDGELDLEGIDDEEIEKVIREGSSNFLINEHQNET